MAVWNSKYNAEFFTSNPACNYRIDLLLKDYTGGSSTTIKLDPEIIQEWQDDDPKTPIRGCTLRIKVITNDPFENAVNYLDFYSNEDDTWKAILKRTDTDETLFIGYLLQDDCSDICIDYTHTFNLTFSDNLGLMKDVSLLQASIALPNTDTFSSITVESIFGNAHKIFSVDDRWGILNIGNTFTIYSGGLAGTYTVIGREYDPFFNLFFVYTAEDVPIGYTVTDDIDYFYYTQGITGYQSLKSIFTMLIYASGIRIPLNVMTKLVPIGGTNDDLLRDTFINVNTFLKNDGWMNCYDILEMICIRFNACFFQAHGSWYFVRWDELYRYTTFAGATYQGNAFNADMNPTGITKNIIAFDFLAGNDMETGTIKSIIRPDLFVNEQMNYQQQLTLKNQSLEELGALLRSYQSGTTLINEYELLYWINWDLHPSPTPTRFIRVILNNDIASPLFGTEIERYIVVKGLSYDDRYGMMYEGIELSEGDTIEWSFDYRTENSEPGVITSVFEVDLRDGINPTKYIATNGQWVTPYSGIPFGLVYNVLSGDNANQWHNVTVTSDLLPWDAFVHPFLGGKSSNNAIYETHYRNLKFTVYNNVNNSTRVIGHTHNTEQFINVKKNNSKEIFIDNTPKSSISGTFFLNTTSGFMRNRIIQWHYPGGLPVELYPNLGQPVTQEALFTNYIPRYKFEGNLLFVNNNDKMLTPFSVFNLKTEDNQFRFVPGKLTINYHANQAEITLHELIRNPAGIFGDQRYQYLNEFLPSVIYNFNYLYEKS
jgi:hypothetical protein